MKRFVFVIILLIKVSDIYSQCPTPAQEFPLPVRQSSQTCGSRSAFIYVDYGSSGGPHANGIDHYLWYTDNDVPIVDENGDLYIDDNYQTPVLNVSTTYKIRAVFEDGCVSHTRGIPVSIKVAPQRPIVEIEPNCDGREYAFVSVLSPTPGVGYRWYDNTQQVELGSGSTTPGGPAYFVSNEGRNLEIRKIFDLQPVTVYVAAFQSNCLSPMLRVDIRVETGPVAIIAQDHVICGIGESAVLEASGAGLVKFKWYEFGNAEVWATGPTVNTGPLYANKFYIVVGYNAINCPIEDPVFVKVSPRPAPPVVADVELCAWQPVSLSATVATDVLNVNWYAPGASSIAGQGLLYKSDPLWSTGMFTYLAESVNADGCNSVEKTSIAVTVTDNCDDQLNWIHSRSFDTGGLVSETRSYFDNAGNNVQDLAKSFANARVFATQSLRDRYDRVVGSTLSAPLAYNEFKYNFRFMTNGSGKPYSYLDFDVLNNVYDPVPANNTVPGTLGWFYSNNNTWEDHVASTRYPYTRSEFYQDGTGEVKRSAGAGDSHRLGAGHEVLSGTFPVFGELNDYLAKRTIALPGITQDGSLTNEAVQSVVRDENGKYSVSIADKAGNTVMTCRPGTATDNVLIITNEVTASGNPASFNYRPMTYFYILHDQQVSITGSTDFVVENIVTDERMAPGATFANSNGNWSAGFYRILLNNTTSNITLRYTNYFLDVAYQYYDDTGRQKVSVSPNGYKAWMANTPYDLIDKTTYTYNHQGWLLTVSEPDAGETRYVYRKDGNIRFSQNALQKFGNRFSYTHYDALGRPVESGEYIGTELTFTAMDDEGFGTSAMKTELQTVYANVDWASEEKTDWMLTRYDFASSPIPNLPSSYAQQFVRGAVSTTENANIKTWYSYDEQGRVTWMAQKPVAMNRTFLTQYTYDFLGNVITAFSQSYTPEGVVSPFYHHYEYDADKRLSKVYTSIDGSDKKLRATYAYYLHGPLKRIVLGDDVQGIDFVYNVQGWLTQINHPDKLQDPGGDANDAFGMVLDYYESAMSGLFPVAVQPGEQDIHKIHHLPGVTAKTSAEVNNTSFLKKAIVEGVAPYGRVESNIKLSQENSSYLLDK